MQFNNPTSWNNLTKKQLLQISNLFTQNLDKPMFLIKAFLAFNNLKVKIKPPQKSKGKLLHTFIHKGKQLVLSDWELRTLTKQLEFILKPSQLTENKLPILKKRIGPNKALSNISWTEFETAEKHFNTFSKTKNIAELDKLIATLYRPTNPNNKKNNPDFTGDERIAFNPFSVELHAKHFRNLPLPEKFAVYLFYSGCRNNIVAQFDQVFNNDGSDTGEPDPLRHINLINAINNDDVTKNDNIRQTALYEILIFLQKKGEDADKQKGENT